MQASGVVELWDESDDDLFEALGLALLGPGSGMSTDDPDGYRRFGREWFNRRIPDLRRRICGNAGVQALSESNPGERLLAAATIYQILCQFNDYAANAMVLAVLLARVGIGTFCAGFGETS